MTADLVAPDLRRSDSIVARRVCFSKRRRGRLSKTKDFSTALPAYPVALRVFSECGWKCAASYGGGEGLHAAIGRLSEKVEDRDQASGPEASFPQPPVSSGSIPLARPPFFPSPSSPCTVIAGGKTSDLPGAVTDRTELVFFSAF